MEVGGGAVILTYGHTDLPCARTVEDPSIVLIKDAKTGAELPALHLKYKVLGPPETRKEILKAHEGPNPKVRGVSIRGKKFDSVFTCNDKLCTSITETVTKGEYYSFALCTDVVNRLSLRLDQPDAPEIIRKAKEHINDGKCMLCTETVEFYIQKGYDRPTSESIVKESLELYSRPQLEDNTMEAKEVRDIVKEELKVFQDQINEIKKSLTPAPAPASPAPAPIAVESDEDKIKKAVATYQARITELESQIAKAKTPGPTPGPNSGASGPVAGGMDNMAKGALQGQEPIPDGKMTDDEYKIYQEGIKKFRA